MTTKQAISILKKFNKWRRGDSRLKMPNPKQIGIAIDIVVEQLELKEEMVRLVDKPYFKQPGNHSPF